MNTWMELYPEQRSCSWCLKKFLATRPQTQVCSVDCASERHNHLEKERRLAAKNPKIIATQRAAENLTWELIRATFGPTFDHLVG
jgi:hypothetical protein